MGYILDTIRGKNDPDRKSDPRYIGDYGIGTLIRKGSAWGLDQLTFGAVDALTDEVDKYGNLRFKKPGASDAANFYIRALPNVSPPVIQEKKEQPDYGAIINQAEIYGNSRFNQQQIPSYENRPVHIPRSELTDFQKGGPLMTTTGGVNYDPILGEDELTESFKPQWQKKARQGEATFYYDITGHRILNVPGMDNPAEQTRYKSWLTQSLINRHSSQLVNPQVPFTFFHSNKSFYDSQGMEWRLVRTDKSGKGPTQPYEPMPLNEIDSRKLKAVNTSESERVLLRSLMKLNVSDRNRLEKENPNLIQWNSDISGQNYHEHMIGLDETEFWNSGAGKALGYMNNDVYNLEKGIGNIVFLNDPRFKIMKDNIAEYITPHSKEEVYPGLKKRINPIKTFTNGPYAGMNAVIGYDANPRSSTYTNLVIRAYNPSPDVNESQVVATIPNWYANVYAKDLNTGERVIPDEIANDFIQSYVNSVLEGNKPALIALENLGEQLLQRYGITKEIPAPGGLQQDPDFQSLGESTLSKKPYDKKADEATFKTTPKNQRLIDKWWKKNLNYWQKGEFTQLEFNLDAEFPNR